MNANPYRDPDTGWTGIVEDEFSTGAVTHPALEAQERVFDALRRVRAAAWDAGSKGNYSHAAEDNEENIAHEVTAAIADLVKLALGVSEVEA